MDEFPTNTTLLGVARALNTIRAELCSNEKEDEDSLIISVYCRAETVQQFGELNVAWCCGVLPRAHNTSGPPDEDMVAILNDIIELNRAGFITTNGQPHVPNHRRSCVFGMVDAARARAIRDMVEQDTDRRFVYYVEHPDGHTESNAPLSTPRGYQLTRGENPWFLFPTREGIRYNKWADDELQLFRDFSMMFVTTRDFDTPASPMACMREALKKHK